MHPYRKETKPALEDKDTAELAKFGVRLDTGRPILERVDTNRCRECGGFGTYGNPFCGAVYTCQRCAGCGYDPEPILEPVTKKNVWQKFVEWLKK